MSAPQEPTTEMSQIDPQVSAQQAAEILNLQAQQESQLGESTAQKRKREDGEDIEGQPGPSERRPSFKQDLSGSAPQGTFMPVNQGPSGGQIQFAPVQTGANGTTTAEFIAGLQAQVGIAGLDGQGVPQVQGQQVVYQTPGNDQIDPVFAMQNMQQQQGLQQQVLQPPQQQAPTAQVHAPVQQQQPPPVPHKPPVGSEEWHRQRRDNHKEVERRRRETINEGINELAKIVPGCEKNKGSILQRAVQYIQQLKESEATNIEKWTLEKLLTEQAIAELHASNEKLKAECERAWREAEMWKKSCLQAGGKREDEANGTATSGAQGQQGQTASA